jgi:hypothetical protein
MYALVFYLVLFITLYIRGNPETSTSHEKARCVLHSTENKSDRIQCNFLAKYQRAPQSRPSMCEWHKKSVGTIGVVWQTGYERSSSSAEDVERIPQSFSRNPQEYIGRRGDEPHIPRPTVRKVLYTGKLTRLTPCRLSGPMIFRHVMQSPRHNGTTVWR